MTRLLFTLLFFVVFGKSSQAQAFVIDKGLETIYVKQVGSFNDSTKGRSLFEIAELYKQNRFEPFKSYNEIAGIGDFDYWFVVKAKNASNAAMNVVFEIPIARLSFFTMYEMQNSNLVFVDSCGGTGTKIYNKPLWSYSHAIAQNFKPKVDKLLFFKINKFPGSIRASVIVHSAKAFDKKQRKINTLLSFLVGIGCIVVIASSIVGFYQKNYAYYVFSLLVFLRISHTLQFFNYADILNVLGFTALSSSTLLLISLAFQYQFFKLYFNEKIPVWAIAIVAVPFLLDATLGGQIQSYKFFYYFNYAIVFCLGIYYIYQLLKRFKTTTKSNYLFLVIELAVAVSQSVFILNYRSNFTKDFLYKYDYDLLLWGCLVELFTFLFYLFRGVIVLNADFLKQSVALAENQKAVIQIQETERKIIAEDLHDDLGATLSALKGSIVKAAISEESQNLLNKAITDLRAISRRLLPADFETYGFIPSLEKYIEELNQQQKLKITLITFGKIVPLNTEKELNIYRIITELVNNSMKHSNGQNATVQLIYHEDYLFVSVEDDGEPQKNRASSLGIGLKSVTSRLEYLNAIQIEVGKGEKGYSSMFEIPYFSKK